MTSNRAARSAGEIDRSPIAIPERAQAADPSDPRSFRLRYQELFDFAPDAQVVTDLRGVVLEANYAAAALFGHSKAFLIGKPLGLLLRCRHLPRFYQSIIRLARSGRADEFESRIGGREVAVRAMAADVTSSGSPTLRWQFHDITLRKNAEHARTELLQRLVNSQENERRRISREIHDQLGQDLTALTLGLKRLEADLPEGTSSRACLHELQEAVDRLGRQTHDMAFELRPAALDDLGLSAAIEELTRRWSQQAGIVVGFHCAGAGNGRVTADVKSAVYRMVQEALTNVARHAKATAVSVIIEEGDAHLMVLVEDDGQGFDAELHESGSKLGLLGMCERVAMVGGSLQVESSPGAGTTIRARIPCKDVPEGR